MTNVILDVLFTHVTIIKYTYLLTIVLNSPRKQFVHSRRAQRVNVVLWANQEPSAVIGDANLIGP